jgi:hypothetical protein
MKERFKDAAIDALYTKALSDMSQAEASLHIMLDNPAGIGDHSTGDLYDNLNEALSNLADAEDRLETLINFVDKHHETYEYGLSMLGRHKDKDAG